MHRIFSGDGWFEVLDICKSARDNRRSQPLVQHSPILLILLILCIDVNIFAHWPSWRDPVPAFRGPG